MPQPALTSVDLALLAVGRTVLNFQRLEQALKLAARLGPLQGTIAKIQRDIERRAARADTMTLGQSIQAWLVAVHSEVGEAGHTPDLFDDTIEFALSLAQDAEASRTHGARLKSLLATRNRLIHSGLVQISWDSPDQCEQLVAELDIVNEQIGLALDLFSSQSRALSLLSALSPEEIEKMFFGTFSHEESRAGAPAMPDDSGEGK